MTEDQSGELFASADRLSRDEVTALEQALAHAPNDLRLRLQLFGYYTFVVPRRGVDGAARHDEHALWLIEHHPELDFDPFTYVSERDSNRYRRSIEIWDRHLAQRPDDMTLRKRASSFFALSDYARAKVLLARGAALTPDDPEWQIKLAELRDHEARSTRSDEQRIALAREALADDEPALAAATDVARRHHVLRLLTEMAFLADDHAQAQAYAAQLLSTCVDGSRDTAAGFHQAHITLGRIALLSDDVATAKQHLAAAAATPGSAVLSSFGPDQTLAQALLARGERDAVLRYVEACKRFFGGHLGLLGAAYRSDDGSPPQLRVVK